jgi:hypothetical protein
MFLHVKVRLCAHGAAGPGVPVKPPWRGAAGRPEVLPLDVKISGPRGSDSLGPCFHDRPLREADTQVFCPGIQTLASVVQVLYRSNRSARRGCSSTGRPGCKIGPMRAATTVLKVQRLGPQECLIVLACGHSYTVQAMHGSNPPPNRGSCYDASY